MLLIKNCDSINAVKEAQIAQLVEQETENLCVVGSIPSLGTTFEFCMTRSERERDALDITSSCFVFASAGSGKTKILVDRYVKSMFFGIEPSDILSITYSKAAVYEIENRISYILKQLYLDENFTKTYLKETLNITNISKQDIEKASQLFFKFQDSLSQLKILTIHSFCQSLLLQFPFEADILPDFRILDETEGINLMMQAKETVLNQLSDNVVKILSRNFSLKTLEDFINNIYQLLPKFSEFFSKNTTLEAYKNKASNFFNVNSLQETISCKFSVVQKKFIEKFFTNQDLEKVYLTQQGILRKRIPYPNDPISKDIAEIVFENYVIKNKLKTLEKTCSYLQLVQKILEEYQLLKNKKNVLDFTDVLYKTKYLLTKSCAKEFVISKICSQIKSIMIDEAQDLSPIQWELIRIFGDDIYSDPYSQKTLFVVGDIKQSIYRFQGADCDLLAKTYIDTTQILQKINKKTKMIYFNKNYRSLPKILDFVDKIFAENNSKNLSGETIVYQKPIPFRQDAQGKVEIIKIKNAEMGVQKKSEEIAINISKLMTDNSLILTRSRNELSENIMKSLINLGIKIAPPDRINLPKNLLIMDLLAIADICIKANNEYAIYCVLKSSYIFEKPLTNSDLLALHHNRIKPIWEKIKSDFPEQYAVLDRIISWYDENELQKFFYLISTNLHKISINDQYIIANFMDEITKFSKNNSENIPNFLEYFRASSVEISNQNISKAEIRLSTIHGSKGLEADTVFLLDYKLEADKTKTNFLFWKDFFFLKPAQKNSFPEINQIADAEYEAETRELYRLLYVAMTRSRNNLYIFTSGDNSPF